MATRKSTTSQGPVRLLVIVLFFVAGFRGQKILSETKRCGDPGCESLMIRAQASRDYKGPDCRYLNFKSGEEILVYYKLSGKRDDLWQGSQGKKYGYFPKDAVKVEEVFISKEVEVPAMETDFICLDGGEYIFENEDSVLHDNDPEMEYMYPDIESYLTMPEGELLKPSSMSLHMKEITNPTAENYNQEATQDKSQSSGSSRVATKNSEHDPIEETEDIGSTGEPSLQEPINDAWSVSSFTGWLGMGGKQELKDLDPTADPLQENSFHSRKIALSDEINLGDSGEKELSWFGSGFSDYLPFGKTETEEILEEKHMITETETQDNTMDGDSENDAISIGIDPVTKKEEIKEPDSAAPGSNWLSLGLDNVLNLGQIITGTINKEEKQKDENIDWTDSSEPNLISDSLEPEIRTNHDENLNIDGSGADRMQNSEASSDYKELSYSDQASASKEISLSEEYEPKKGAEELSTPSWFKLGIEKILNLQESSKGNTIFKKEQTEVQIEIKEAPLQSAPVEAELGPISEDTAEMGSTVTEDTMNDQTDQLLKESKNPENNPLTAGLVSNNLQNILNLKMLTGTIDSPSAHDITYTEQPTEVYNGEKSLESQLPQHAAVEERTKEAESKWNKPAMDEAPRKTSSEKNSFLSGDIDQKNEQSQQVNMLLSEDGAEKTHDSTFQLSANTTNDEPMHKQDAKENSVVENVQMGQQPDKDFTAAVDNQEDKYMLLTSNQGHRREVSSDKSFPLHPHSPGYSKSENALYFGVIQYLQVQDIPSHLNSIWSTLAAVSRKAVALLPEDLRPGPDLHGVSWEMVICAAFVGVFTVSLFLCQASKAIRSWRYVGREKELASKVAELVESKCKELEQLSIFQKQYEELEQSLQDASLSKESCETSCLEEKCQELNRSNSVLSEEIENLEKDLEEEKLVRSQQDNFIDEIQKRLERLEIEAKTIKSQADEARTTLKVFQINKGRLETALQDAKEEHIRFQESNEQLLQEAEGWGERFSELTEQTKMFESSKRDLEEALHNKESQVKSLTECLLTMKDWSLELGQENNMDNNNLEDDVSTQTENEELLDDHQKRTVKKLIYAAKLNASLKTLEEERNQLYVKLSDEVKSKEELAERIDHLQKEQNTLHSENSHFECDVQKLQQKLRVMTEMYQENELKLHRKLTVEEKDRLQKEEKLSKADEKIYHAAEELQTYRTRSKDLEEELEKTIRSYQSQIVSHEKKGHDNWLAARAAERHLNDIKKENAHSRQKLTEFEFKLELLEKDPYALDVPRMFGRENSPYGPSSLGRPSPETRAFLSPPTLLEGPLRISPMLPGGERASRSPGDNAEYSTTHEQTESGSDHQGAHSDTGSLSPPWEKERRVNIHTSGQHYPDPPIHPRRQEKYYPNPPISGRFSGPAELIRGYNMHSFDRADGQLSMENNLLNDSNRNGANENHSNPVNIADHTLHPDNEAVRSNFAPPPPLMRGPLLPMDPRGPFLRRIPPFPPRMMDMYGPREYFPVPEFSGIPHHPAEMRIPFPPRPYLPFPLQRPGYFPPTLPPETRSEPPTRLMPPPEALQAEDPKSQEET
ncbi:melanoma inhibitory activity protein 2 isoform X4 [Pleurodeles waltl]|uniref:melanoma inhibitory activity protein 2 isoform X4 n=1 Tax=Pleurodeles waltl TaxID=8319 RepID=UPI003709BAB0